MPQISSQHVHVQRINPTAKATPVSRGVPLANAAAVPRVSSELAGKVANAMSARTALRDDPGLYDRRGRMDTEKAVRKGTAEVEKPPQRANPRGGDTFTVSVQASDSGYANRLVWSDDGFKTMTHIGVDNQDVGKEQSFTVARGKKVEFGIVSGDGNLYRAGSATRNADGIDHAQVTRNGDEMTIGFEDLYGGGDMDFNDAVLRVRGLGTQGEDLPEPEPASSSDAASGKKTNRSGLGDGSNPGRGAGRVNSPNEGALNPGEAQGRSVAAASTRPSRVAAEEAARAGAERNRRLLEAMYGAQAQAAKPMQETRRPALEALTPNRTVAGPFENAKSTKEAQDRKAKEAAEARKAKEAKDVETARKAHEAEQALQARNADAKRLPSEATEATRNASAASAPRQDIAAATAEAAKPTQSPSRESIDERKTRDRH